MTFNIENMLIPDVFILSLGSLDVCGVEFAHRRHDMLPSNTFPTAFNPHLSLDCADPPDVVRLSEERAVESPVGIVGFV
jgi:hypothetical protein